MFVIGTLTSKGGLKMEPFKRHTGVIAPLNQLNVDTDQILPKQFMKRVERSGYGQFLFYNWRFNDEADENPNFVLNQSEYKQAAILLAGNNFGCGSSREHAVWALKDYGFQVIIAPSFADIFRNNCFKNGVLPLTLSERNIIDLFQRVREIENYTLTVDLEQNLLFDNNGFSLSFEVEAYQQDRLLQGLDDIAITLSHEDKITAYENRKRVPCHGSLPIQD